MNGVMTVISSDAGIRSEWRGAREGGRRKRNKNEKMGREIEIFIHENEGHGMKCKG